MYDIKQEKRRCVEDEMHAKATRRWRGQVISASPSLPSILLSSGLSFYIL
jgi:hypothetical protein